ncbi:GAF domain-containing protein [Halorarum salinum]|uniref:histidine kinase n=2 Tax=Halorarum salinum TaxID=2743089 RepID=A0A7D5QCD2_9EURY|nr:GAF domain-containing protein [Halobaculum salinum]
MHDSSPSGDGTILDVFARSRNEPLTTSEVATMAGCSPRTTRETLEALVDQGRLLTKEVGPDEEVWWSPDHDREHDGNTGILGSAGGAAKQLQEISTRLIGEDDIDALYEEFLEATITIMDADFGSLQKFDSDRNELRLLAHEGFDPDAAEFWKWVDPESSSTCSVALETDQRVVVSDVETCEFMADTGDLEMYLRNDIRAVQTTPLISRSGTTVGMISTHWRTPHEPSEDTLHLLDLLARQAADLIERTQAEQALRERERRLKESNERLEQFAYAASHDLQEPLRMVSSYLQLIERRYADEFDDDGREFLEFAIDGADRMRHMIDGLLKYSRVETEGNPFEPTDLDAVLMEARKDLQLRIEETDARITAESLPRVSGDRQQLRQVFQNLLDNAIEYSGGEPPRVEIWAERGDAEWTISVRDEGIGIDPEYTDRIFEMFRNLHEPDEHSGAGIGLALCERILERHGGRIRVESTPGQGSTFSFTLPEASDDEK